ncbi:MAG TPA: hypothetical protein DER09_06320 [Prolixibacteraceae bacterium]|nr:hypothetical protein [Prolixibacteraceae bacterium]
MAEVKAQKIVVFLQLNEFDKNLILNGIRIATIFKKELCLFYQLKKSEADEKEKIKALLAAYVNPVKNEIPELPVSTLILHDKLHELPDKLADDYEAILLLAGALQFPKYAKALAESPVPFLFVNESIGNISTFKKLVLPVDLRKENSDSALWSSYFGRFNGSGVVVVAASDKNKDEQKQVMLNVALAKKLFGKFKIEHKIFKGAHSSLRNTFEGFELAISSGSDLLVILGSSTITPLDWLIGLPEQKIIKRAGNLPVLVVNPQRDNYILCD